MAAIVPTVSRAITQLGSFGTALPMIGGAQKILGAVQAFSGDGSADAQRREQDLALQQLQARQGLQQQQQAAQSALERERIAANAQTIEQDRRAALRRAVSRQRAQFGASGVANQSGGSSEAVLLGLFEESEEDLANRQRLDNLKTQALDLSLQNTGSLNILQRTQLQERQKLDNQLSSATSGGFGGLF